MYVRGGQPVNFNYAVFSKTTGLNVAALVYDVSSGIPFLTGPPIAMIDLQSDGVYVGQFTPLLGNSYLVISAVYEDSGFTTVSPNFSPAADDYDAFVVDTTLLNFNYVAYDQDPFQTINATVYNLTNNTNSNVSMSHVIMGVYFGRYQGALNKQYAVVKVPVDPLRSPGCDSFQAYGLNPTFVTNVLAEADIAGQSLDARLQGQSLDAILTGS